MIIAQRRVQKIENYLGFLDEDASIVIGLNNPDARPEILNRMGFIEIEAGLSVLPAPEFGKVSEYNAEGDEIIHKDRPMERVWRMVE